MIGERHFQSLHLSMQSVECIGDGKWKVLSENGKTFYEVMQNPQPCPEKGFCKMECSKCELCIHSFLCTCPDSLIMNTICKHIHLVKRSFQGGTDELTNASVEMPSNDGQQQEIEHILTGIRSHPDDIAALKTRVKERLLQIMDEVDQCSSSTALKQLEKQMTAAANLFASVKGDEEQEVIPLKVNEKAPVNKNMKTAKCFA